MESNNKIGRNDPCPCGSGQKHKKCCGSPLRDARWKSTFVVEQLRQDGPEIAASFDKAFGEEILQISEQLALFMELLRSRTQHAKRSALPDACLQLLANASQTSIAALELLRHGFRLQPGILIRNAVETICVALSLFAEPALMEQYENGKLQSSKVVSRAKEIVPGLGWAYGFFSKEFAHIGKMHQQMHDWGAYEKSDQAATMNLKFIKFSVNLLTISAELIFHDSVSRHRYWKRVSGGNFSFEPSNREREWQRLFLS